MGKADVDNGVARRLFVGPALNALESLDQIVDHWRKAESRRKELSLLDSEVASLEEEVRTFIGDRLSHTTYLSCESAIQAAVIQLQTAESAKQQMELALRQLDKLRTELVRVRQQHADAVRAMQVLYAEAGCDDRSALFQLAERSKVRREKERQLENIQQQLLTLSDGQSIDEYLAETEAFESDSLLVQIQSFDSLIEESTQARDEVIRQFTLAESRIKQIDGVSQAADVAQEIENLIAKMEEDIRRYSVLRIASNVLKIAIERHREKNRGPIIERASQCFPK